MSEKGEKRKMEFLAGVALVPIFIIAVVLSFVCKLSLRFVGIVISVVCVVIGLGLLLLRQGV